MTNTEKTGSKYTATRDLSLTEIARLIRADIKAAILSGALPKGIKVSTRTRSFAGGGAVDVEVTAWPLGAAYDWAGRASEFAPLPLLPPAAAALATLKAIHASYNFDNSDIMTDYFHVRYYGHAEFSSEIRHIGAV